LPALGALLLMRAALPTPAEAWRTWAEPFALFADAHPTAVWLVLFATLSSAASYWSFLLFPLTAHASARGRGWVSPVAVACVAAVSALAARRVFGAYAVLSTSMLPTLEPGDTIAGNRLAYGWHAGSTPKRGDIIVFHRADAGEGSTEIVKRVIGLPGDRISMKNATPVINGWEVPQCDVGLYIYALKEGGATAARLFVEFIDDRAYLVLRSTMTPHWPETYEVKPGQVFVLGDNRDNSFDSRSWNDGKGDGLAITAIDARAERSLFGLQRDGRVDLLPLLRRLDPNTRLDGVDTTELRNGIGTCLKQRPAQTRPPGAHAS
jgi:signal peptidase I